MRRIWLVLLLLLLLPGAASASLIDDLRAKINNQTSKLQQLETEIEQYQQQLEETKKEAQTLESAVETLDLTSRKLSTDISVTENKITNTNLSIQKLEIEIDDKETRIRSNRQAIAETIRALDQAESTPLILALLNNDSLSDFWSDINLIYQVQQSMRDEVRILSGVKRDLAAAVIEREGAKKNLESYKDELADRHQLVEINKEEKNSLLTQTKNKESEYQAILKEKIRQKEEFERELLEFESQLQVAIDPDALPHGTVFRWPLDIPIRITQLFGNSYFAQQNPSVYGGRAFHPGTDFGAPVGSVLRAPLSATVWHTGNTDSVPDCYSWGKWVLLKHNNGLSTLYAHLSLINVSPGDEVETGDIIGYTGNTGFSTGPHLHMTTYATKGVRIVPFEDIRATTRCGGLVTPAASSNAYLDSLDYLPDDYELHL